MYLVFLHLDLSQSSAWLPFISHSIIDCMTDINLKFYFLLLYAVFNVLSQAGACTRVRESAFVLFRFSGRVFSATLFVSLKAKKIALCAFDVALCKIKKNLTLLTIPMVFLQPVCFFRFAPSRGHVAVSSLA